MTLTAGHIIDDKVELVRPLGSGSMGTVWLARHLGLDTNVAVKLIAAPEGETLTDRSLARFRREASLAAKIKSPHVVRMFDFGVVDGQPYIVMELLEGRTLADRLQEQRLTPKECSALVAQLAKALITAHDNGVIHRDIKPANVFLVEGGYKLFAKLLDFGVAKQPGAHAVDLTVTGAVVGTPYYMSPEQLTETKDADHRADLWALAVVAYRCLAGEVPFDGANAGVLAIEATAGRFAPLSSLVDFPATELDIWFKLAFCRNIRGRPQSAADMAESFARAIRPAHDTVSSAPPAAAKNAESADETTSPEISVDEMAQTLLDPGRTPPKNLARLAAALALIAAPLLWWLRPHEAPPTPTSAPLSTAVRASSSATTPSARRPAPTAPPTATPPPTAAPTRAAAPVPRRAPTVQSAAPPDCTEPFTVDDKGHLIPKRHCLR